MKGIARTQKEIEFHDRVAQLGCISCRQEGNYNPWVSIHHAHGRTKPGCHMWVLPLCGPHHMDEGTAVARHPNKRRWEAKYGNEDDLIRAMWTELGVEFTEPVRVAKPVDKDRPKRATSESSEIGVVKLRDIKPKVDKPVKAKIQSAKSLKPGASKPTLPKAKSPNPAKPKSKIQSCGFKSQKKPTISNKLKMSKTVKPPLTEKQVAYLAEVKAAAKARQDEYKESNKEAIELRRQAIKDRQKRLRKENLVGLR